MTEEMRRVIANSPVDERRGNFLVSAYTSNGGSVISAYRDYTDFRKSIHLCISLSAKTIRVVASHVMLLDVEMMKHLHDIFSSISDDYDEENETLYFNTSDRLMDGIDNFLKLIEEF